MDQMRKSDFMEKMKDLAESKIQESDVMVIGQDMYGMAMFGFYMSKQEKKMQKKYNKYLKQQAS